MFLYKGSPKGVLISALCVIGFLLFIAGNTVLIDLIRFKRDLKNKTESVWFNDSFLKQPYVNWKLSTLPHNNDTIKVDSNFYHVKETTIIDSTEFWTIKQIKK
jgi:hypothetical protein